MGNMTAENETRFRKLVEELRHANEERSNLRNYMVALRIDEHSTEKHRDLISDFEFWGREVKRIADKLGDLML